MFLLQSEAAGWVGPTAAISLVIIALAFLVIALAAGVTARQAVQEMQRLARVVDSLRTDLGPALTAIQAVSGEGQRLAQGVGAEAEALVSSSRRLREGVEHRLQNLEAIYDVLEVEVEETALEIAVTLRRVRAGAGWFGLLRRLLGSARRLRKRRR